MNFTPQDVVHYLRAAAGTVPPGNDPGVYLVSEDGGDLVEKMWTGTELADQVFIGSAVRANTPAAYFWNEEERCVFCVGTDDVLRCYRYDATEDEWEEVGLRGGAEGELAVHRSGRLSGGFVPGGKAVFFEDPSGQLRGIQFRSGRGGGEWERLPALPSRHRQGGAHLVMAPGNGDLHIIYAQQDGHAHQLSRRGQDSDWQDRAVPGAALASGDKFMAIPTPKEFMAPLTADDYMTPELFVLTSGGMLTRIDSKGIRTDLGEVNEDGRFIAATGEQCVIESMKLIKMGIGAVMGIARGN